MTGTNTWPISKGVPYAFGLARLMVHGNKANNPNAPVVVRWYGKGFTLDDVTICNGKGGGLYTECAAAGGQQDITGADAPESVVYNLVIHRCHGHGWEHRGPHDMRAEQIFIMGCKTQEVAPRQANLLRGLYVRSSDIYNASGDFGFAHIYDCDIGFEADGGTNFRFEMLIAESNKYEGVVLNALGAQIGMLKCYKNWRSRVAGATDSSVVVGGSHNIIGSAQIRTDYGGGGLRVSAANCQIQAIVDGANTAGTGVVVNGSRNQMRLTVVSFDGIGGVGVELAPTAAKHSNHLAVSIGGCVTGLKEATKGNVRNTIIGSINNCTTDISGAFSGSTVMLQTSDEAAVCRLPALTATQSPAMSHDNAINSGAPNARWKRIHVGTSIDLRTVPGEPQPRKRLSSSGLEFGEGGSHALDCRIDRDGAGRIRCYDEFLVDMGLSVGNTDCTITRLSAGQLAVGGNPIATKAPVPATVNSPGVPGQWAVDTSYVYFCTAPNTWVRATVATW